MLPSPEQPSTAKNSPETPPDRNTPQKKRGGYDNKFSRREGQRNSFTLNVKGISSPTPETTIQPSSGDPGTPTVYEETFEAWRRETHNPELQPLRPGFYKDAASHLRRLKEAQRNLDQKSLKAAILEEESRRLQQLLQQLLDKRREKIRLTAGKTQAPVDNLEKWLLEEYTLINRHLDKFKEDLAQGREPSPSPEKRENSLLIRFVKDIPSIIGVDLKTHGPFQKEDLASLPSENAESLIRQGAAVQVRTPPRENG